MQKVFVKKEMTTFPVVLIYSSLGDWQRDNDGHCNASGDLQLWGLAPRKQLTFSCVCSTGSTLM